MFRGHWRCYTMFVGRTRSGWSRNRPSPRPFTSPSPSPSTTTCRCTTTCRSWTSRPRPAPRWGPTGAACTSPRRAGTTTLSPWPATIRCSRSRCTLRSGCMPSTGPRRSSTRTHRTQDLSLSTTPATLVRSHTFILKVPSHQSERESESDFFLWSFAAHSSL